jgi:hypothetical protein
VLVRREDGKEIEKLASGSHKKVWCICDECECGYLQSYRNYLGQKNGKLCNTCRKKEVSSREETRQKRSLAAINNWEKPEYVEKIRKSISKSQKEAWKTRSRESHTKLSFSIIQSSFENEGYELLTEEKDWENTTISKLKYMCPNGHVHEVRWGHWNNGHRDVSADLPDRPDQRIEIY